MDILYQEVGQIVLCKDVLQGKISASDFRDEPEEARRNLDAEDLEDNVVLQAGVAFHEALMIPKQPAVTAPTRVARRDEDVVEAVDAILAAPPPAAIVLRSTLEGARPRRDGFRNLYDKYAVTCTYHPQCSKRRNCMASEACLLGP